MWEKVAESRSTSTNLWSMPAGVDRNKRNNLVRFRRTWSKLENLGRFWRAPSCIPRIYTWCRSGRLTQSNTWFVFHRWIGHGNFAGRCAQHQGKTWAGPRAHSRPTRGGPEVSRRALSAAALGEVNSLNTMGKVLNYAPNLTFSSGSNVWCGYRAVASRRRGDGCARWRRGVACAQHPNESVGFSGSTLTGKPRATQN